MLDWHARACARACARARVRACVRLLCLLCLLKHASVWSSPHSSSVFLCRADGFDLPHTATCSTIQLPANASSEISRFALRRSPARHSNRGIRPSCNLTLLKVHMFHAQTCLHRVCGHLNFTMASLIIVGLIMVLLPPLAWERDANSVIGDGSSFATLWLESPIYAMRDVLLMLVGAFAIFVTLWEFSSFTDAAQRMLEAAMELEFPNGLLALELTSYLRNINIAFTINDVAITRSLFIFFLEAGGTAFLYLASMHANS